jgi:hypothetical protein
MSLHHVSAVLVTLTLAATLSANMARAEEASYFGRWTVKDEDPKFSTKGKLYKTFDVAPCGKDFCGVSVGDKGTCGKTLFRFLTIHARDYSLKGHGLWGKTKKNLQIAYVIPGNEPSYIFIGLGDGEMDITGREGSVPTFEANYKRAGQAKCVLNESGSQS